MIVWINEFSDYILAEFPDDIGNKITAYQQELDDMLSRGTGPLYCYFDNNPSKGSYMEQKNLFSGLIVSICKNQKRHILW